MFILIMSWHQTGRQRAESGQVGGEPWTERITNYKVTWLTREGIQSSAFFQRL